MAPGAAHLRSNLSNVPARNKCFSAFFCVFCYRATARSYWMGAKCPCARGCGSGRLNVAREGEQRPQRKGGHLHVLLRWWGSTLSCAHVVSCPSLTLVAYVSLCAAPVAVEVAIVPGTVGALERGSAETGAERSPTTRPTGGRQGCRGGCNIVDAMDAGCVLFMSLPFLLPQVFSMAHY